MVRFCSNLSFTRRMFKLDLEFIELTSNSSRLSSSCIIILDSSCSQTLFNLMYNLLLLSLDLLKLNQVDSISSRV